MRICATLQLLTIRVLTPSRFRAAPQEESLQAPRPSLSLSLSLSTPFTRGRIPRVYNSYSRLLDRPARGASASEQSADLLGVGWGVGGGVAGWVAGWVSGQVGEWVSGGVMGGVKGGVVNRGGEEGVKGGAVNGGFMLG